jgi:hypothetical protein
MYKEASRLKLRFNTNVGQLSTEQLWDLSMEDLDNMAVALEDQYKNSKGKSFLLKKTTKDKTIKLRFDIVLDILNSKIEERDDSVNAAEINANNQKILEIIKKKKDSNLEGKSIKELEKMIK